MADVNMRLVLCAPLSFAVNRIHTLETDLIVTALNGHYSEDAITAAKKQLKDDVDELKTKDSSLSTPRIQDRHNTDRRKENEVNDIIKLLKSLDESMSLDKLPKYVADGPDSMPYFRVQDGDFRHLIKRISDMEAMLKNVYTMVMCNGSSTRLNTAAQDIQHSSVFPVEEFPPLSTSAAISGYKNHAGSQAAGSLFRQAVQRAAETDKHAASSSRGNHTTATQPAPVKYHKPTSNTSRNNASSAVNSETETDTDGGEWQSVNRKKRRRVRSAPEENADVQTVQTVQRPAHPTTHRPAKTLLVGRKSDTVTVSAAKSLMPRKYVYYVDNLSTSVSSDDLVSFVESLGVRVMNCYEVKPRRSAQQKREMKIDNGRRAYRLCINRADKTAMLQADMWPKDVIIKRWYWRKDTENEQNTDYENDELIHTSHASQRQQLVAAAAAAMTATGSNSSCAAADDLEKTIITDDDGDNQ